MILVYVLIFLGSVIVGAAWIRLWIWILKGG